MRSLIPLIALLALAGGCKRSDGVVAHDVKPAPALSTMVETPGDWSDLATLANREPAESGLLLNSPIVTDLNAMLGPDADAFRQAMSPADKLTRVGAVLASASPKTGAYLMIDERRHAIEAGLERHGSWRVWRTPATTLERPPAIARMVAG